MFFKLFLLFVIFPVAEIAILIKIGTLIGIFNTVALILVTALAGAYMVKMEGMDVIYRFQENILKGVPPTEEIFDGLLVLMAGALLLTPGILTDFIGFLCVFPPSRGLIKAWLKRYIRRRIEREELHLIKKILRRFWHA